jgi:hypothetical protein
LEREAVWKKHVCVVGENFPVEQEIIAVKNALNVLAITIVLQIIKISFKIHILSSIDQNNTHIQLLFRIT